MSSTAINKLKSKIHESSGDVDKIIELIVNECCSAINSEIDLQNKAHCLANLGGLNQARYRILEHFGMK